MLDFSDVTRFAARLATEPDEDEWQGEWSNKVADEMRANIAVDTGFTRSTIQVTSEGVTVGGAIVFLEYGTSKMAPQPVAQPSVNRLADRAARDAGDRVIRQLT